MEENLQTIYSRKWYCDWSQQLGRLSHWSHWLMTELVPTLPTGTILLRHWKSSTDGILCEDVCIRLAFPI
jgi:hypothetical protein